ncbi:mucin-5B-like [Patiria miniata]|uniref:VWFD domain-containing protein n=1 Tax=Patiria miniata TaxID=46514 RepID=A0A913YZF3_PATMI|nr:mucin-5B-like [Patiria miniata]
MARIFLHCLALLVAVLLTRCNAMRNDALCRKIERVYYRRGLYQVLSNVFEERTMPIDRQTPNYMLRWVCCDGEDRPDYCGKPFCDPFCPEYEGECNLEDKRCRDKADIVTDSGVGRVEKRGSAQYSFEPSEEPFADGNPDGMCTLCCGGSIRTFDGLTYNYPLQCRTVLASFKAENQFTVDIVPKYECNDITHECRSAVNITNNLMMLEFLPGGVVRYNNRVVQPPYSSTSGILIFKRGAEIVFEGTDETRVFFDGINGVSIEVNRIYQAADGVHSLRGLCGNYDNDHRNDLDGLAVADLAGKYKFPEGRCQPMDAQFIVPFSSLSDVQQSEVRTACNDFARDPIFKECRSKIVIEPYHTSCWFSMSLCILQGSRCDICSIYAEFSETCARHGVDVEWRSESFCHIECSNGMEYVECGTACPRTCENMFYSADCAERCVPSCQCPYGTYLDGELCIPKESCPCLQASESFPAGAIMKDGCRECVCMEGMLRQCTTHACPATCSILGGHAFRTFDGSRYEFDGKCEYVLAQNLNKDDPLFGIFMDKSVCDDKDLNCVPYISIMVPDGTTYELQTAGAVQISKANQPTQELKLPYSKVDGDSTITVTRISSVVTRVALPKLGIEIMWGSDNRIYLSVTEHLFGKIHGLCGNFNQVLNDDFQLPSGSTVAVAQNFVGKWISNALCEETDHKDSINFCEVENSFEQSAKTVCGKLKSEPFLECSAKVDVTTYLKQCQVDRCNSFERAECLAFAAYAWECAKVGVEIDWRSPDLCRKLCFPLPFLGVQPMSSI